MPKRMLDDSLLSSPSVARCTPRAQDAWPRMLLLADDFGCLDANLFLLKGRGWALRHDVKPEDIGDWLAEYVAADMVFLWEQDGHTWAYLRGWYGPHGQKWREEYKARSAGGTSSQAKGSKRRTPAPPGWDAGFPDTWRPPTEKLNGYPPARALPPHTESPGYAVPAAAADPAADPVAGDLPVADPRGRRTAGAVAAALQPVLLELPPPAVTTAAGRALRDHFPGWHAKNGSPIDWDREAQALTVMFPLADVAAGLEKAAAWLRINPRRTPQGVDGFRKFVQNWLRKDHNAASRRAPEAAAAPHARPRVLPPPPEEE